MGSHKLRLCYPCEDLGGVYMDENYIAVRHISGVCFSFAKRKTAINAHFSASGPGLRKVKEAIEDFCQWAFKSMPWLTAILATIEKPSVARLVEKCAFVYSLDSGKYKIYMRKR